MGTSALGGFASGLQQGIEFQDTRRRNKAIDNLLDRDAYEKDLDFESRRLDLEKTGGTMPEFNNPTEDRDPWLVRGFNWLKGKFGNAPPDSSSTAGVVPSPPTYEYSEGDTFAGQGYAIPYADGGEVNDEERMKRSYGKYYNTEAEVAARRERRQTDPNAYYDRPGVGERAGVDLQALADDEDGGGPSALWGDVKRAAIGSHTGRAIANLGPTSEASARLIQDAAGAESTGRAVRGSIQDAGQAALNIAGGVASDVADTFREPLNFIKGFVGYGGTRDNRQPDPDSSPLTEAVTAAVDGDKPSDAQVADKAIQEGVKLVPGHPDNPDQAFDWAEVSAAGVRPEEIPHMGVKDWSEYRIKTAQAAALRGESVEDAMMKVTKMQMDGFSSNMMQASFLAKQGDARGAALAARAAFQYFPNGSDVRFGMAEGKNGPVLVGMGVDEETGQPVGRSKDPMVLTADTLAMYAEMANNPEAWRVWTKDWHEMASKDREYYEVTYPTAQQALNTDAAREDAFRASAAKDRAYVAGGGASGGGLKQSDLDRAYDRFMQSTELQALEDPARAEYLADIMARIYQRMPNSPFPTVIRLVMEAEREGTLEDDIAALGLRDE